MCCQTTFVANECWLLAPTYSYSATFHPLTNRKHHCRLCGQIICSLPIKHPQREVTCSILFVVDTNTREIEEVGEGVDYGVRRRRLASTDGPNGRQEDEDKFLKGVRICRDCRPILLWVHLWSSVHSICRFNAGASNIFNKPELSLHLSKSMRLVLIILCRLYMTFTTSRTLLILRPI